MFSLLLIYLLTLIVMNKFFAVFVLCASNIIAAKAQLQIDKEAVTKEIKVEFMGDNDKSLQAQDNYNANLFFEAKEVEFMNEDVEEMVEEKTRLKLLNAGISPTTATVISKTKRAIKPTYISGFTGAGTAGTPPDNSVAVNSKGQIVNMVNSQITVYTSAGVIVPSNNLTMFNFFKGSLVSGQSTQMKSTQCDPKILFDCENKRYIAFGMTCVPGDTGSRILIAFSKTEDATQGWWIYNIKTDQFNQGVWFDHPRIAINGFDFFASGNMFNNNSNSYSMSYIYQLDKMAGYNGDPNLKSCVHYNLNSNPFTPTLVRPGNCGTSGDIMHVLSTNTSFTTSSTFDYHVISGKALNLPTKPVVYFNTITTTIPYTSGGYAVQPNTTVTLKAGDVRGQDAFLLNNVIHFAFHFDAGSGYNGIHYNRITKDANGIFKLCNSKKINKANVDMAYPCIFNFDNDSLDGIGQNTIIGYLKCSSTEFPSMACVAVDNAMSVSQELIVKAGAGFIDYASIGGNDTSNNGTVNTRWGDYTGMWRQIASGEPTVQFSGHYGGTNKRWINFITKISAYGYPTEIEKVETSTSTIYPNPSNTGNWYIYLPWNKTEQVSFVLFDAMGKKITELLSAELNNGNNVFNFNTNNLSKGTYFVVVNGANKTITKEKLIIQ